MIYTPACTTGLVGLVGLVGLIGIATINFGLFSLAIKLKSWYKVQTPLNCIANTYQVVQDMLCFQLTYSTLV